MHNSLIIVLRNFMNRDAGQARPTAGLATVAQLTGKEEEATCFLPWCRLAAKPGSAAVLAMRPLCV